LIEEYPLIMTAGRRHIAYYHSMGRQIPWLRELAPEPVIEIHPETAKRLGIGDGDWVWIETPRVKGQRVKQKAKLTLALHPQVVQPEAHWWFPERQGPWHGAEERNINMVVSNDPPYGPIVGTVPIRSLLCKIHKAEED
jgi:anaerobic selenocysteine-containing dehydrogenase